MKKLLGALILLLSLAMLLACIEQTATDKESKKVDQQLSQYSKGQPVPAFDWSLERELVIKLYGLRNAKVVTHTVWRSEYGMIEGDTPSIGFGIPYDTSLTNPLQLTSRRMGTGGSLHRIDGAVEQQEPNGIYASKNTTATWVMSTDEVTGDILPLYIESKVTVYPYPVVVDYKTNRVTRAGDPSVKIDVN